MLCRNNSNQLSQFKVVLHIPERTLKRIFFSVALKIKADKHQKQQTKNLHTAILIRAESLNVHLSHVIVTVTPFLFDQLTTIQNQYHRCHSLLCKFINFIPENVHIWLSPSLLSQPITLFCASWNMLADITLTWQLSNCRYRKQRISS